MRAKIKLGIIGFGNMGKAISDAFCADKNYTIHAYDQDRAKTRRVKKVSVANSAQDVISLSDILILAIKPQDLPQFLKDCGADLARGKPLLITIAAGVSTRYFEKNIKGVRVIRVMPNLAAKIRESVSLICKGKNAKKSDFLKAKMIFSGVGELIVASEKLMDKASSISGSGPGLVFYIMNCMYESAHALGFKKSDAKKMVLQTFFGSVKLAKLSKDDFKCLVNQVASKKGTTQAGLKSFKSDKLNQVINRGVNAAYTRAAQLSQRYGG
ncbi:MAG: pyrroline-5-carboxylate reductase [Candidatus Omnitrophica bacterium]|nr:pyrroline-5-carboxylate reductase [Candidatus Omnitrophota bacterium]